MLRFSTSFFSKKGEKWVHKNHLDWANLEDNPIDKKQVEAEIDQQLAEEYHDEEIPEVASQKEEV